MHRGHVRSGPLAQMYHGVVTPMDVSRVWVLTNTVVRGPNGSTFILISWRINNRGGVLYTPEGGSGIVQRICDRQKRIGKLNLVGVVSVY